MYIVTFTAQQRKMVQTPHFFWAGNSTAEELFLLRNPWVLNQLPPCPSLSRWAWSLFVGFIHFNSNQ